MEGGEKAAAERALPAPLPPPPAPALRHFSRKIKGPARSGLQSGDGAPESCCQNDLVPHPDDPIYEPGAPHSTFNHYPRCSLK